MSQSLVELWQSDPWYRILFELQGAAAILTAAMDSLESAGAAAHHVTLTLLSQGFEKVQRVTLGVLALVELDSWPSPGAMGAARHDVSELHTRCLAALEARSGAFGRHERQHTSILAIAASDQDALHLLKVMAEYASGGRFFHYDQLALNRGPGPTGVDPFQLLAVLRQKLLQNKPTVPDDIADPEWSYYDEGNRRLVLVARRLCAFYWRIWSGGLCGPQAQTLAVLLRAPAERHVPDAKEPAPRGDDGA